MWIRSEDGKLFNADGAHSIQIEDREGGTFVVVIEYSPVDLRSFNLTKRDSLAAAELVLSEIENAMENGVAVLNLCKDCGE